MQLLALPDGLETKWWDWTWDLLDKAIQSSLEFSRQLSILPTITEVWPLVQQFQMTTGRKMASPNENRRTYVMREEDSPTAYQPIKSNNICTRLQFISSTAQFCVHCSSCSKFSCCSINLISYWQCHPLPTHRLAEAKRTWISALLSWQALPMTVDYSFLIPFPPCPKKSSKAGEGCLTRTWR